MGDLLSIVVPVFNEVECIVPLHREIVDVLTSRNIPFEVLYVDDGSTDGSGAALIDLATTESYARAVILERNYGQSLALRAGIDLSCGAYLAIMDGDLQNDPNDIPKLLSYITNGFDFVQGVRTKRRDNWLFRRLPSQVANSIISWYLGVRASDIGCGLKVMRRPVAIRAQLSDRRHRYLYYIAYFQGARCFEISVNHRARTLGKSKYGLRRVPQVIADIAMLRHEFRAKLPAIVQQDRDSANYFVKLRVGFPDQRDCQTVVNSQAGSVKN